MNTCVAEKCAWESMVSISCGTHRFKTTNMKLNQWELGIIGLIIIVMFSIGYNTHPFRKPTPQKKFEQKIVIAETYYEEAKAISLSMPLLNDTILAVYADSLFITLVTLNHDWVVYVKTQEGFEKYTTKIENLNGDLDGLRLKYTHELLMRSINRTILRNKEFQKKWKQESEKYDTNGTGKFV